MIKVVSLSASQISSLLFYTVEDLGKSPNMPQNVIEAINKGKLIHQRLGYSQTKQFSRYLFISENLVVFLSGMPDRIELPYVIEFKTYHSQETKERNLEVAKVQINVYSFLTGLKKQKIILYDVNKDQITDEIELEFSKELFIKSVAKAIEIKEKISELKKILKDVVKL